jgi:hypothetical protein
MTSLDIAAYMVLEDSVNYELPGSFHAAVHVSGQLYVDVPRSEFWRAVL